MVVVLQKKKIAYNRDLRPPESFLCTQDTLLILSKSHPNLPLHAFQYFFQWI